MTSFTPSELATWTSNPWKNSKGAGSACFQGLENLRICHDTRTLKEGDVYIAIKGENFDGHDFVEQAVENGAAGLIVEREFPTLLSRRSPSAKADGTPQLIVPDTMAALWQLAAGARSTWAGTVIGITGSVGKTTVKELAASVLEQKGTVAKTLGNWNNDIGLPLSMLAADRFADFFVFELGMNHPGEINPLAELLKPDWALITNIGKAHTEFFPDMDGIAKEKSAILNHTTNALLNADSEWFDRLKSGFGGPVVPLTEESFSAPQPGAHMIQNTRFAATLGLELGLSPVAVQKGLDSFKPLPMRWQTIKKDGVLFINDAYNANPLSMRAAISTFAELPGEGRKFVVLGGMRELGASEAEEHRTLGEFADSLGFDFIIRVGSAWPDGIKKNDAAILLRENLRAGDRVLLKASRGERIETILEEVR